MSTPMTIQSFDCAACGIPFSESEIVEQDVHVIIHASGAGCGYLAHQTCSAGWTGPCPCGTGAVAFVMPWPGYASYDESADKELGTCSYCKEPILAREGMRIAEHRGQFEANGPCGTLAHPRCIPWDGHCACGRPWASWVGDGPAEVGEKDNTDVSEPPNSTMSTPAVLDVNELTSNVCAVCEAIVTNEDFLANYAIAVAHSTTGSRKPCGYVMHAGCQESSTMAGRRPCTCGLPFD